MLHCRHGRCNHMQALENVCPASVQRVAANVPTLTLVHCTSTSAVHHCRKAVHSRQAAHAELAISGLPTLCHPWQTSALHCIAATGLTIATMTQYPEAARQSQALTAGEVCSHPAASGCSTVTISKYDKGEAVTATTRCTVLSCLHPNCMGNLSIPTWSP